MYISKTFSFLPIQVLPNSKLSVGLIKLRYYFFLPYFDLLSTNYEHMNVRYYRHTFYNQIAEHNK